MIGNHHLLDQDSGLSLKANPDCGTLFSQSVLESLVSPISLSSLLNLSFFYHDKDLRGILVLFGGSMPLECTTIHCPLISDIAVENMLELYLAITTYTVQNISSLFYNAQKGLSTSEDQKLKVGIQKDHLSVHC